MTGPGLTIAGPAGQVQMAPGQNRGGFREIPSYCQLVPGTGRCPAPTGCNPLHPVLFYVSL